MNAKTLRYWLQGRPQAARILIYSGDTAKEYKKLPAQNWGDVARTIASMDPDRIELTDANGVLLRATRLDESEDDQTATTTQDNEKRLSIETQVHKTIETTLGAFAQHLADAYKFAVEKAFDAVVEIANSRAAEVQSLQRAVESQNRTILSLQEQRINEKLEEAEEKVENADPLSTIVNTFVTAKDAGAADAARARPNGKGNGKAQI